MSRDFIVMEFLRTPEPTLQQEMGGLGDDDVMDFMNLGSQRTGIEGTVFISTAMGSHGPRVKYFAKTGKGEPSFSVSISEEPRVLANSLPERVVSRLAPKVIDWVRLNHEVLATFWFDGGYWDEERIEAFKTSIRKLEP
jgi:hypothetical protein